MKLNLKKWGAAIGVGAVATACFIPAAWAIDVKKDSTGAIIVTGLTASQKIGIDYPIAKSRNVLANACGLLVVKPSTSYPIGTTIKAGATTLTVASLPTNALPKCTNGTLEVPVAADFKTGDGSIVFKSMSPSTQYKVEYPGTKKTRNVTANACGFAKAGVTAIYTNTGTVTISSTDYNLSTMTASAPPLCRQGVLYNPAP